MGVTLPKYLINAEKKKIQPFEAKLHIKIIQIDDNNEVTLIQEWRRIRIHILKSILYFPNEEHQSPIKINENTFLINQDLSNKTLVFGLFDEKIIIKLYSGKIKKFLALSESLIYSRIPQWKLSPICQLCSFVFGRKKKHHCRNCGNTVCRNCYQKEPLPLLQMRGDQKVCNVCKVYLYEQKEVTRVYQLSPIEAENTILEIIRSQFVSEINE